MYEIELATNLREDHKGLLATCFQQGEGPSRGLLGAHTVKTSRKFVAIYNMNTYLRLACLGWGRGRGRAGLRGEDAAGAGPGWGRGRGGGGREVASRGRGAAGGQLAHEAGAPEAGARTSLSTATGSRTY